MTSGGPRILVIEDNLMNLELVLDLLEGFGGEVRTATSAEDGLEIAFEDPPDLILLDVRLPGMDGLEAVRRLKADTRTAHVPTLALTAEAMKGDEDRARGAGFDGYVAKPIDTRSFSDTIRRHLAERGRGARG